MDEKHEYAPVSTGAERPAFNNEPGQLWRQYLIGAVVNILVILSGYVLGWTSPVNMKLQDVAQSPFDQPITVDQEAWIGSLAPVGAMFGPFVGSALASRYGRKISLIANLVPLLIGFILIAVAQNVGYLYAARVMWGIGLGMAFTVCPMYCVEIATLDARGALGSFIMLFVTMGYLVIYVIGPYISYYAIAFVGIALVGAGALFVFLPESPKFLLMNGNRDRAAASLMMLRGKSRAGVEDELYGLTEEINASLDKSATIADVFKGTNFKAFYISCVLLFFQQFSGIGAVMFYMSNIFAAAGSKLSPSLATICIGIVQLVASCVTSMAIDKIGRKMLMLISTGGATIGLGFLGLFFLLDQMKSPIAASLSFLPLLSLIIYMVTYCFGLGPVPWVLLSELLPIEMKAVASPLATMFCWSMCFLISRYFGPIAVAMGMHIAFWIFSACCALGFVFTYFVVPETKGKSALEIEEMLAGQKSKPRSGVA